MALRGTLTHWKTQMLAKTLGIDLSHALGLLEALWHVTADKTPSGNIGKLDNKALAMQMFTRIKPDKLVDALVASKHLDRDPVHRLLVHDWAQHADYNTKRKVSRNNGAMFTANGDVEPITSRDASHSAKTRPPDASIQMPDAREKDDNTVSGENPVSSSLSSKWNSKACQECWNRWRGSMKECKYLGVKHHKLFDARLDDGLTADVCRQVVVKMAATPHFIGETTGWIADYYWLLGTHKDSGEANFRKVLHGDYDPRGTAKKKTVVPQKPPSYKDFAHHA
jgi:hypothetical protein